MGEAAKGFFPAVWELGKIVAGLPKSFFRWYDLSTHYWASNRPLTKEEEAELSLMNDLYVREGGFRMAATYFNGLGAALAYGPGTKEFYTDKERLRAKYHYQKDQFDIDNMQAGEATAEVAGFWEGVKHTVADDAVFFEGKATAQEELSEIEKAKASAAQNVQDAVAYLNELDLADNIDLSLAPVNGSKAELKK